MIGLETERLVFRQWRKNDLPALTAFYANKENARFVGGSKTREEAWRLMAAYIGHYELNGFSYLAVIEKGSGDLIGTIGLWNSEPWPEPELGYWLLPRAQGKGFGSEAGLAVKNHALDVLKFDSLVSYIDPVNRASINLALKLGASYDSSIQLLNYGPHAVYRYR